MPVWVNKLGSRKPNFFIVGAPRCGTTAMYEYLRQHPDIFMPLEKEPYFFGDDLIRTRRFYHYERDIQGYLNLFSPAGNSQKLGEGSTFYLKSRRAAREIREFSPAAKIIIMLRNPVDMLHSLHNEVLQTGSEDIEDFACALEAETYRRRGLKIPRACDLVDKLLYRDIASFTEQVERYFKEFGRESVHVIIYDDFRDDTPRVYRETLRFLGVTWNFRPQFNIINSNYRARSNVAQYLWVNRPVVVQRVLMESMQSTRPGRILIDFLGRVYRRPEPRTPMNPDLRRSLQEEFSGEVEKLSDLLGRDLTHWTKE